MALSILDVAQQVGEKGMALKVDKKLTSHLTPLHMNKFCKMDVHFQEEIVIVR